MTRADYLNCASDLRRAANWLARGQREKLPLIEKTFAEAKSRKVIWKILKNLQADMNLKEAFKNKRERVFLAEQTLISSSRLQNLAD